MPELSALVQDILDTHHAYLYEHMPALDQGLRALPAPPALLQTWERLVSALESHLLAEEEVLFPAITEGEAGGAAEDLSAPIRQMMAEHDQIRGFERTLRGLAPLAGPHEAALVALLDDLAVHAGREDQAFAPLVR